MDSTGSELLNQAINSPADISREELLVVLKECSNLQNSYSQQSAVNKLINSCINYKKFTTLANLLRLIGTRAAFSFLNTQMISLNDAFSFLLQTSNTLECYEIVQLFQDNNVELPERCLDLVISSLISTENIKQAIDMINALLKSDKALNLNLRDHLKSLLMRSEIEAAFLILEKVPITSIGALYLWEDMIKTSCSTEKAHQFREFLSNHVKATMPNYNKEFEEIYSVFIKTLVDNKCSKEIVMLALKDVSANNLTLKITAFKPALAFLVSKNLDTEVLIRTLKQFSYMLTSDAFSYVITTLLQKKQFAEAVSLLDLIIHDHTFKFKYGDLNLSINDYKLILYLQNYAIRKEMLGEKKPEGESEYEMLLPDKSINDPIDKIAFDELSSYLSKDSYDYA